jgi:hypothetical protein
LKPTPKRRPATVPGGTAHRRQIPPAKAGPTKTTKKIVPAITKKRGNKLQPQRAYAAADKQLEVLLSRAKEEKARAEQMVKTKVKAALSGSQLAERYGFSQSSVPLGSISEYSHKAPQYHSRTIGEHEVLTIATNGWVGSLEVPATITGEQLLYPLDVTPANSDLVPEYVREFASQFVYYRITHFQMKFNPSKGGTQAGSIGLAYVPDPTSDPPSDVPELMNVSWAKMFPACTVSEEHAQTYDFDLTGPVSIYSVGNGVDVATNGTRFLPPEYVEAIGSQDQRLTTMGRIWIAGQDFGDMAAPTGIGYWTSKFTIEFMNINPHESSSSCDVWLSSNLDTDPAWIGDWNPLYLDWASPPNGLGVTVRPVLSPIATKGLNVQFSRPGTFKFTISGKGSGFGAAGTYGPAPSTSLIALENTPVSVYASNRTIAAGLPAVNSELLFGNYSDTYFTSTWYVRVRDDDWSMSFGPNKTCTTLNWMRVEVDEIDPQTILTFRDAPVDALGQTYNPGPPTYEVAWSSKFI